MSLLMQLTDVAEKGRLEPMTGAINAGEILHLVGPNGAGKSTHCWNILLLTGLPARWPTGAAIWCSSRCRRLRCRSGII